MQSLRSIRQKSGATNDEGYSGFFERKENQFYFMDMQRVKGFAIKPNSGNKLRVCYINDYLVTDFELYSALCKMYPTASDHEIYFCYLDSKYSVYSYH